MLLLTAQNAMRGVPLVPAPETGFDSWTLAVVLALLVAIGFNARHVERLFRTFFSQIWSVRQRGNIFEQHVASESQALLLMLMLTSVMEGVLLSAEWPARGLSHVAAFAVGVGCAGAFNLFSVAACHVVGYVFASQAMALQWRRGLYASQAALGLALLLPATLLIVSHGLSHTALGLAAALYIAARLMFIVKGFRIFYTNFYSLLYFILYLCTLEIIPLLVLGRCVAALNAGDTVI